MSKPFTASISPLHDVPLNNWHFLTSPYKQTNKQTVIINFNTQLIWVIWTYISPRDKPESGEWLTSQAIFNISVTFFKCPYHQHFYFPIWSCHSCNEVLQKNFLIWIKSDFFYENPIFFVVHPCRWSQHQHAQICDVDSGTCDFSLDLSRLFYLCKFSFIVHAQCSVPAFCMNY